MPQLKFFSDTPVRTSVVEYDPSKGEEIFLVYSHGREHGPGIERDGEGAARMAHMGRHSRGEKTTTNPFGQRLRSWLIAESLAPDDHVMATAALPAAAADPAATEALQDYIDQIPTLSAHDLEFITAYGPSAYRIVGMQGCGDLTMNLWNVAYVFSRSALNPLNPELIFLYPEPILDRTYSCLVKRRAQGGAPPVLSIEPLRFDPNAHGRGMVMKGGTGDPVGDKIEFAVASRQVLRGGKGVSLDSITHQFSDLRHLIKMPNVNPAAGRPRYLFGRWTSDDVWFGEAKLIQDVNLQRAALHTAIFLDRFECGGAEVPHIRTTFEAAGYNEETDPTAALTASHFRISAENDRQVEIFFERNVYPWNIIGLTEPDENEPRKVLALACDAHRGALGQPSFHKLEDAVEILRTQGAYNALLVDEGQDVFQFADIDTGRNILQPAGVAASTLPTRSVAGGIDLSVTVPADFKRTRLRAVFVFAKF